jgi:hypothetical protein
VSEQNGKGALPLPDAQGSEGTPADATDPAVEPMTKELPAVDLVGLTAQQAQAEHEEEQDFTVLPPGRRLPQAPNLD